MNDLVMIDSSCWIKYFRNNDIIVAESVEFLIKSERACICGMIELEIIQGIRNSGQELMISKLFSILPYYEFTRNDFINSGNTIKILRLSGITLAPSDTLIASLCLRNDIMIYSKDSDFNYFPDLKRYL